MLSQQLLPASGIVLHLLIVDIAHDLMGKLVQPLSVVDNSSFAPTRLTTPLDLEFTRLY